MRKIILINILRISLIVICVGFNSCKKLIEIDSPIENIVGKEIYNSNATANSVLLGLYSTMSNSGSFAGVPGLSLRLGLASDELTPVTGPSDILTIIYKNALSNDGDQLFWSDFYSYIFRINAAIEGISASKKISDGVRKQLLGEATFLRAFVYFYITNLYGDAPILLSTNIEENAIAPRSKQELVYQQIIKDLIEAESLLSDNYVSGDGITVSSERIRPNKKAATALLAKAFLYTKQWQLAEIKASEVVSDSRYSLEHLESVFLSTSREAIWQLQPVQTGYNTEDARAFILSSGMLSTAAGPNPDNRPVFLSKSIYDNFELGDNRKLFWTDTVHVNGTIYPFASKYKKWVFEDSRTEYLTVFRLSEQLLIRAEARLQLGILNGNNSAQSDINLIRDRAGLSALNTIDKETLLLAITKERKSELFTEFGNRWLDLKRLNKIDEVMQAESIIKGSSWSPYKALFPIPVRDIQTNPSFKGHQNSGYPEQ